MNFSPARVRPPLSDPLLRAWDAGADACATLVRQPSAGAANAFGQEAVAAFLRGLRGVPFISPEQREKLVRDAEILKVITRRRKQDPPSEGSGHERATKEGRFSSGHQGLGAGEYSRTRQESRMWPEIVPTDWLYWLVGVEDVCQAEIASLLVRCTELRKTVAVPAFVPWYWLIGAFLLGCVLSRCFTFHFPCESDCCSCARRHDAGQEAAASRSRSDPGASRAARKH